MQNLHVLPQDGKTYQTVFYSLDAILSVGYRINSRRGTQLRIWATGVLRQHLLCGYTTNQRRLRELKQAIRLVADIAQRRSLSGDERAALLATIRDYSYALDVLDDYDHQRVVTSVTTEAPAQRVSYDEALGRHHILLFRAALCDQQRHGHEGVVRDSLRAVFAIENLILLQEPEKQRRRDPFVAVDDGMVLHEASTAS